MKACPGLRSRCCRFLPLVLCGLLSGCGDSRDGCAPVEVSAPVGLLEVPDSGKVGTPLRVRIRGDAGPDGCFRYAGTTTTWASPDVVQLRATSLNERCPGIRCAAFPPPFDDTLEVTPRSAGWLRVEVVSDRYPLADSSWILGGGPLRE